MKSITKYRTDLLNISSKCSWQWISGNQSMIKALISFSQRNYVHLLRYFSTAPPRKNAVSAFQVSSKLLLFYLGRFLKKLADDQCSSITKGSIYHIKYMYIHPFTIVVNWPEIGGLMEVSTMFYICRYCVFTWWGRASLP